MASRITVKKTEGAKIAVGLGIMFYIDPDGRLYFFMNADKDDIDYDKYKLIELTVKTLDEKCVDVWCIGIENCGFRTESGKVYNWEFGAFHSNSYEDNAETVNAHDDIVSFVDFTDGDGEYKFALYSDGTANMFDADEYEYEDFSDNDELLTYEPSETFYDVSFADYVKYINEDGDEYGGLAVVKHNGVEIVGEDNDFVNDMVLELDLSDYVKISAPSLVALRRDGRLECLYDDDYSEALASFLECEDDRLLRTVFEMTARHLRDIADFDIYDCLIAAVDNEGKIHLWGEPEAVHSFEKLIPRKFLSENM